MRQHRGDEGADDREALSALLDHRSTVDRAICVLMETDRCDYWAAMRVLVVGSIERDVTVHAEALRVLREL